MLKPLHDHVVLKPQQEETKTKSGIILSSKDESRPQTGKIIAVGPGKVNQAMSVKTNDIVVFKQYAATDFVYEEEKFLILKESDILAIVEVE